MELAIEDILSIFIRLSLTLLDLILIPDSLNVRGEWEPIILGPNEEVLISGRRDRDNWGRVRVVWNGDGSLWSVM
jgi:hypothetical protein